MRILIIRHAEPDYEIDGLTEKGHREAKLLALRLKDTPIDEIYVSPLGRAKVTCQYTLDQKHMKATELNWLQEFRARIFDPDQKRDHVAWDLKANRWRGESSLMDEAQWTRHPLYAQTDVEKVWRETKEGLDQVLAKNGYERNGHIYRVREGNMRTIAFFCHFGIGSAILSHLTGIPLVALWQGTCWLPSGVTTVVTQERDEGIADWRCVGLGDLTHLVAAREPASLFALFPEKYNGCDSTSPSTWPDGEAKNARPMT